MVRSLHLLATHVYANYAFQSRKPWINFSRRSPSMLGKGTELLRSSNIDMLQPFHGILWHQLSIVHCPSSSKLVFVAHSILGKPCLLLHHYTVRDWGRRPIIIQGPLTCSQTAVLLPSPSLLSFCGFAAATLIIRPNSSL